MGQSIAVSATAVGDVALFDLDRSLTGQDGVFFEGVPENIDGPPALLAERLFEADTRIETVYVLSNTVSVGRSDGWEEDSLAVVSDIMADLFVFYRVASPEEHDEKLREENYNATISFIREHNPDLWVMKIRPDEPIDPFKPGQYTTLALGYWEPRVDDALEDFEKRPEQRGKMARRSYSVSSPMVDESGDLIDANPPEVEFYIVLVRPNEVEIPALTPRIWRKGVGDRIFMGRKFTGRYTLDDVKPTDNVVLLSTGTGEAPQNAMAAELLRNGHEGTILSVVTVRYRRDLAYTREQAIVEGKYANYKYLPMTTREPENEGNKVYIQDLLTSGRLEKELGAPLDPANTHVFLCGNPAMIGLPKWDDDGSKKFPETLGVAQLLDERGFTIDHLRERGNVHFEEYWKER